MQYSGCVFSPAKFQQTMEESGFTPGEPLPSVMKAIRVHRFGGPDVLKLDTNVTVPVCGAMQVDTESFFSFSIIVCSDTWAPTGMGMRGHLPPSENVQKTNYLRIIFMTCHQLLGTSPPPQCPHWGSIPGPHSRTFVTTS